MKNLIATLCLLPLAAWGIDREQLDAMLQTAATNQGPAYLAARTAIIDGGTNALPTLAQAGSDAHLSWQQRLVARIAYERIARGKEIDALRSYDWRTHPGYDAKWEGYIVGPSAQLWRIAIPRFAEKALWYYYIELTWKFTGETAITRDRRLIADWPRWCRDALANQAEIAYLHLAMIERLDKDTSLDASDAVELYAELLKSNDSDATTVLVDRFDAYNRHYVKGPEIYPGSHAVTYRGMFEPILSLSDARNATGLQKFIEDHPALADLKPRLAEVQARPAPAAKSIPPFRLGTNTVVVLP